MIDRTKPKGKSKRRETRPTTLPKTAAWGDTVASGQVQEKAGSIASGKSKAKAKPTVVEPSVVVEPAPHQPAPGKQDTETDKTGGADKEQDHDTSPSLHVVEKTEDDNVDDERKHTEERKKKDVEQAPASRPAKITPEDPDSPPSPQDEADDSVDVDASPAPAAPPAAPLREDETSESNDLAELINGMSYLPVPEQQDSATIVFKPPPAQGDGTASMSTSQRKLLSDEVHVSQRKKQAGHICNAKMNTQQNLCCLSYTACYGAAHDRFSFVFIFALQMCPASFFLWDITRRREAEEPERFQQCSRPPKS